MDQRSIIIADRDIAYCSRMAGFFRKVGYLVETTGSTDQVLNSIQVKQAPVLLLGSNFGSRAASADLVHLLKRCNSQLQIIMVTDGMTLAQTRLLREEGVFYHALKPATVGEAQELGQAVACAFEKRDPTHQAQAAPMQPAIAGLARTQLMNALPWAAGVVALILGTNYLSLPAGHSAQEGNSLAVWMFLAFCALIVTSQLLPILRVKPALGRVNHRQETREGAPRIGK
jgi:DNA-binding NtrC family response regulator